MTGGVGQEMVGRWALGMYQSANAVGCDCKRAFWRMDEVNIRMCKVRRSEEDVKKREKACDMLAAEG